MTNNPNFYLAACLIPLLSACGGGGDSGTAPPSFAEMDAAQTALEALYGADAARTDVPSDGTATYNGYVGGEFVFDGREMIGELQLAADFDTAGVTGSADNFSDSDGQAFVGTLVFDGDVVFGGDTSTPDGLLGSLTGDLQADGKTYDTSILLDGAEFYGGSGAETPSAVAGDASGLLDDGALGLLFEGTFIAEKP